MSENPNVSAVAPMEGGGAYNRAAVMQAAGGGTAISFLTEAARLVDITGDAALVVADYGCSQGRNSLAPMRAAISALRSRVGSTRPISVTHIDQPANDFNTLFTVLKEHPESYLREDAAVYSAAVGRSFYEPVLPPGTVTLGWCATAAHWLSRVPVPMPDAWHMTLTRDTGVKREFERQAADDWRLFLIMRSTELRVNGRLVVYLMTKLDDGSVGWDLLGKAFEVLRSEFLQSELSARFPHAAPVFPTVFRSREELLAPFDTHDLSNLELEHHDAAPAPDPIWDDYQVDRDRDAFGRRWGALFRALSRSLASVFPPTEQEPFLDWLEERSAQLFASAPGPMKMWNARMVCRRVG
jgi:hypothetical protein